jgi:hypothetical protein
MNQPIFIRLLEFGEIVGLEGTDFDEVTAWAEENALLPMRESNNYNRQQGLLRDLFFESFALNSASTERVWVLKNEYYFRLLEYRELQESRIAAAEARKYSLIAISISIVAIFLTIFIGYLQVRSPIIISEKQLAEILDVVGQPKLIAPSQMKELMSLKNSEVTLNSKQLQRIIESRKSPNRVAGGI